MNEAILTCSVGPNSGGGGGEMRDHRKRESSECMPENSRIAENELDGI